MLNKVLLFTLALLLCGCTSHNQQIKNTNEITDIPAAINIKVNNKNVSIPFMGYATIKHFKDGITAVTPHDYATKKPEPLSVYTFSPESNVVINKDIKKQPQLKVSYFDRQKNVEAQVNIKNASFHLPKETGKYDYYIYAIWSNCDATYTFLADIK